MKRLYFFLKSYRTDIISALFGSIMTLVAFIYYTDPKMRMIVSLIIVSFSLLIIIYARSRGKYFLFSGLTWERDKYSWIGYGEFNFERSQEAFRI